MDRPVPESFEETPWQRIIREGVAGPNRSPQGVGPQGQRQGPDGGAQPQAAAYPNNAPQAARDHQQPGMPQYAPQHAHGQQPGMPQQPPQWQGAPVPPTPQTNQDFNTRLPGDGAETPNVNSCCRARGIQQPFVAGGQDILKTFKIDRNVVDLQKFSGLAADWKDCKKKFIDHRAGSTGKWRRIFKAIEDDAQPMTQSLLETTPIGQGYTAWDVAEDLEAFIIKHVSDTIYYERRHGWMNGEEGNGLALWKSMSLEHEGNHVLVNKWVVVDSSTTGARAP